MSCGSVGEWEESVACHSPSDPADRYVILRRLAYGLVSTIGLIDRARIDPGWRLQETTRMEARYARLMGCQTITATRIQREKRLEMPLALEDRPACHSAARPSAKGTASCTS